MKDTRDPPRICSPDSNDVVAMAALLYLDTNAHTETETLLLSPFDLQPTEIETSRKQRMESIMTLIDSGISMFEEDEEPEDYPAPTIPG